MRVSSLKCTSMPTGASREGQYHFTLTALSTSLSSFSTSENTIGEIKSPPPPEIISFKPQKPEYRFGEPMEFNWRIKYSNRLSRLTLNGLDTDNLKLTEQEFIFTQGGALPLELESSCQDVTIKAIQHLDCQSVTIKPPNSSGVYTFELGGNRQIENRTLEGKSEKIRISPPPIEIKNFSLNGIAAPASIDIEKDMAISINWHVTGEKTKVKISGVDADYASEYNDNQGAVSLTDLRPGNYKFQLDIEDKSGQTKNSSAINLTVVEKEPASKPTEASPQSQ